MVGGTKQTAVYIYIFYCTGAKTQFQFFMYLCLYTFISCLHWPAGPESVDPNGCLSSDILQMSTYEVPHPVQSCALGVSEIFAYCHKKKSLQRFQLPQV